MKNSDEIEYVQIWLEYNPVKAYLSTLDEKYMGKLPDNTETFTRIQINKMTDLRNRTNNKQIQAYLDGFIITLLYPEPFMPVNYIMSAVFGYLLCQRPIDSLILLLENSVHYLRNAYYYMQTRKWTLPIFILTQLALKSLFVLLETNSTLQNILIKTARLELFSECNRYYSLFQIPLTNSNICTQIVDNDSFDNIFKIFKENEQSPDFVVTNRAHWYPFILEKKIGYKQSPYDLLAWAFGSVSNELDSIQKEIKTLSTKYNIVAKLQIEQFADYLAETDPVQTDDLIRMTKMCQLELIPFIDKYIHPLPNKFIESCEIIKTPEELCPLIPCAATYSFSEKTISEQKYSYFITTKLQYNPIETFPDLVNLLIHEQFGHSLHHWTVFNSNRICEIDTLENTFSSALSEGIAFHRETQFLDKIIENKTDTPKCILNKIDELQFITKKQRLIRYCRVICDIFTNLDIMTVPEACKWIEDNIGISQRTMFYNFFPCHQCIYPGYATTYAVLGNQINQLENKLIQQGMTSKEFNIKLMEFGYQPLSLIIEKMTT